MSLILLPSAIVINLYYTRLAAFFPVADFIEMTAKVCDMVEQFYFYVYDDDPKNKLMHGKAQELPT